MYRYPKKNLVLFILDPTMVGCTVICKNWSRLKENYSWKRSAKSQGLPFRKRSVPLQCKNHDSWLLQLLGQGTTYDTLQSSREYYRARRSTLSSCRFFALLAGKWSSLRDQTQMNLELRYSKLAFWYSCTKDWRSPCLPYPSLAQKKGTERLRLLSLDFRRQLLAFWYPQ